MIAHTIQTPSQFYGYSPEITHVRVLDGPSELIAMAEDVLTRSPEERAASASLRGGYDFTGTRSLPEAIELTKYGWKEGRDHITAEMEQISTPELIGHSILPTPYFAEAGEEADVGRYLSGEPENMIDYEFPSNPRGNIVELIVNCSQVHTLEKGPIIRRGAAIVAAVQRLQTDGYSVGVTMANAVSGANNNRAEHYTPLLEPGGYLDIDMLCFGLAHPSFFRRMIFAVQEHEPWDIRRAMGFLVGGGYGYPGPLQHLPEVDHPQIVIEKDEGMTGGVKAAQNILDRIIKEALKDRN